MGGGYHRGNDSGEKIGQLFFNMGSSRDEEYLKMTVSKYHIGGVRYNPATAEEVRIQNCILQGNSKIPLIIACNTESGGDATFGKVYQSLIDNGIEAIMAGHIMQPAYTRHFNPDIADEDIMPAALSPELIGGLLRGKLGFNGMVLTDASHMVGLTCRMKRQDLIPAAIAAGVDMFLFFNDMEEDFESMKQGYLDGRITPERLSDALHRILALKAHMGLHKKTREELVPSRKKMLETVGVRNTRPYREKLRKRPLPLWTFPEVSSLWPGRLLA